MNGRDKKTIKKLDDSFLYKVEESIELLPFLLKVLSNRSRNSVKSILARGQVKIDDYIVTQYNYSLQPRQTVAVLKNKAAIREDKLTGLTIMHEDEDIIVINKDAGLLSIASLKEKELTAHNKLMKYVGNKDRQNRVFVVHRLDKDTSGVMMFAKSEKIKRILQNDWKERVKERLYAALVEGKVLKEKGYISSWLKESSTHLMYSSPRKNDGLQAITHYKTIQSNNAYSLMEISLETGRKNQIRVHMQDLGYPVVGDKKYGSTKNAIGRLGLHAKALSFLHPTSGELLRFEADMPNIFFVKSK